MHSEFGPADPVTGFKISDYSFTYFIFATVDNMLGEGEYCDPSPIVPNWPQIDAEVCNKNQCVSRHKSLRFKSIWNTLDHQAALAMDAATYVPNTANALFPSCHPLR